MSSIQESQTLCRHCEPNKWIPTIHYKEHIALSHIPTQEEINNNIKENMHSLEEQVEYVLRKVKPAQSNIGLCIQLVLRYFPMPNMNYRIIYDHQSGLIGIEGQDEYMKLSKFLRRVGSVSRADRRVREKYPELDGSPKAQTKRYKLEAGYVKYYRNEKQDMEY